MLYIALVGNPNQLVNLKQISDAQEIPLHFLSKILQSLVKHDLLSSTKGPNGGFYLTRSADDIRLIEVVKVIDGLDMFNKCGIGLKKCSDATPCPIHAEYSEIKAKIKSLLSEKSLRQLTEDIDAGNSIVNFKMTKK